MKKILFAFLGFLLAMNAVAQESNLLLRMKGGETRRYPMSASPVAEFQGGKLSIGGDAFNVSDLDCIEYSDTVGNIGYFDTGHRQLTSNFRRVTFNHSGALKIEGEDLTKITDSSCEYQTIEVDGKYREQVSGGSLIYVKGRTATQNPSIDFGMFSLTGRYNVYVVLVPKCFVEPEDTLHTPAYLRATFYYKEYKGWYSSHSTTLKDVETGSISFKADTENIDTILVAKGFSIPDVNVETGNYNYIHLSVSATSKQYKEHLASREMYIDCLLFVPCDEDGVETARTDYAVCDNRDYESLFPVDSLKSIESIKQEVRLSAKTMTLSYGEKGTVDFSTFPEDFKNVELSWSSSREDVAFVESATKTTATISAIGVGTAVITLTDLITGYSDSVVVTVTGNEPAAGSIIINEIMAANVDFVLDPSFNYGGWIELYNPTDKAVILASCYVSDDAENLRKFRLSSKPTSIAPHGFFNIWFDHAENGTLNQVPFKLDCDGGTIYFSDKDGNLIASQEYPKAISRISYARTTDGGEEWGTTGYPTPAASNNGSKFATEQVAAPVISIPSRVFSENLSVDVSCEEGAKIIYTWDGSTPTESNGEEFYAGTIEFPTGWNFCYRFRAFKDGYLPSAVVGRSWIGTNMDFEGLPVISVLTDEANLWSNEYGIFVQGYNGRPGRGHSSNYNTNMDWDRPVEFVYIVNDSTVFQQEVGMACCGGWSRTFGYHSSFKLKANKLYDMKKTMDFPFFSEKPYLRNKTLQIRNGGNDCQARIKDAIFQTLVQRSGVDIDGQSYQPTVHFLNGTYYGIINMREPNNKDFVYANYGWDSEDIDLFEMSPDSAYCQSCGTKDAFLEWYELSKNADDPATYEEIKKRVDIDEYINYMALEFYLRNWDWPQNNVKAYRHRNGGKFRFITFDLDGTLNNMGNPFTAFENKKNYTFDKIYPSGTQIRAEIEMVTIFTEMLKNEEFRRQFIDAYCLMGGSVLEPSRVSNIAWELCDRVGNVQYNYEGYNWSPYSTTWDIIGALSEDGSMNNETMIRYAKNYSRLMLSGQTPQKLTVLHNEEQQSILYNGQKMPTGAFSGLAFLPVTLEALPVNGKEFMGWYDVKTDKIVSREAAYTVEAGGQQLAPLYKETGKSFCPVRINEVSAANDSYVNDLFKKEDWVEFYNTTDEDIDMAGMYITDNPEKPEKYQIEGSDKISTIIPAHGYKIIWFDKKEGISELHAPFKLSNDGDVLYLTAADKSWTDSLTYVAHDANLTVGRFPDGADNIYLMNVVTIGKSNICTSYMEDVTDPTRPTEILPLVAAQHQLSVSRRGNIITINSSIATEATLNIYSPDGRPVVNEKLSLNAGITTYTTSLPEGIYIVHVKSKEGRHASVK